ncbi:MAG: FeoA family protein [Syntrophomonadaceae bacterium]
MYLSNVEVGQKARVVNIEGKEAAKRLFGYGILSGTSLELKARHPLRGPLVVSVGGTQVAVGRRMAEKIEVELDE